MKLVHKIALASTLLSLAGVSVYAQDCGEGLNTLTVGLAVPFVPWENVDDFGIVDGFDIDLACNLRELLGFNNIVFVGFPSQTAALTALQAGEITVVISGFTPIPSDFELASFVKYNDVMWSLLFVYPVPPQYMDPTMALAMLNTAKATVGVVLGSIEQLILTTSYPDIMITTYDNVDDAVAGLTAGAVVAVFSNMPTVDTYVDNSDGALAATDSVTFPASPVYATPGFCIGINNSDECCQFYANVASAIQTMNENGTLGELQTFWDTGTFTPMDLTPPDCTDFVANSPLRNLLTQFIFDKYCPCNTQLVVA